MSKSSEYGGYPSNFTCICDKCESASCNIYCHADLVPLFTSSEYIHAPANLMTLCTLCKNAPVDFDIMDDVAFLCTNCYFQTHSTNTLDHCHNQVLTPLISSLADGSSTTYMESEIISHKADQELENTTDSLLLLNPDNKDNLSNGAFMFGEEVDEYFDLFDYNASMNYEYQDHYNQLQQLYNVNKDTVVPVHSMEAADRRQQYEAEQQMSIYLDIQRESPKSAFINTPSSSQITGLNPRSIGANTKRLSQLAPSEVPMLYMDGSQLPKATAINMSSSCSHSDTIGMSDQFLNHPPLTPSQISKINRKVKVLRYIEKRKTRKVVKKVRYASRKAYAQIRPRVRGRFSRKTELEFDIA